MSLQDAHPAMIEAYVTHCRETGTSGDCRCKPGYCALKTNVYFPEAAAWKKPVPVQPQVPIHYFPKKAR